MSKSVVLVLEPNHESEYGEYANIPAFNAHGDIIGRTGGEVPESGHSCEFNVLNDEGFTTCASSTTVNKLRGENTKLRELIEETYGYYVSGTLTPCDFCKRLDCEGNAPTTCEADEYDPDGIVNDEIERRMRELGVEIDR